MTFGLPVWTQEVSVCIFGKVHEILEETIFGALASGKIVCEDNQALLVKRFPSWAF